MNCKSKITSAINLLDLSLESPEKLLNLCAQCARQLENLDVKCNEVLLEIATELFSKLADGNWLVEEKIKQIVIVLANRKYRNEIDLLIEILFSEEIDNKEDFVETLGSFKSKRAIPALIHTIKSDKTDEEDGGFLRAKSLNALSPIANEKCVRLACDYLSDVSWRVRYAAAKLLLEHGNYEISNLFMERIYLEDDPTSLDILLEGLVKWNRKDVVQKLKKQLKEGDFDENEDMFASVTNAISRLERL